MKPPLKLSVLCSVLAEIEGEDSPGKPYIVEGRACYFLDRDPKHFSTILNYLRNGGQLNTDMLPTNIRQLREQQFEAHFYGLNNLIFNMF